MSDSLLVAGYLTVDVSCLVDAIPGHDERITARSVERGHGGMAANAACAAARLGTRVRFFGHAGTDAAGAESIASLEAHGVDASAVLRTPGGGSICVILVTPDGGRAIVSEPLDFDWTPFDEALAAGAEAFHVDGYRLADALPRARACRASIDLDGFADLRWEDALAAARAFSVVFVNRGIAQALGTPPTATADELVEGGADVACVTLGSEGVVVASTSGRATLVLGVETATLDTTGAGDVFAGAFLHRLLGGAAPVEAAAFANAAASISTRGRGARGLVPTEPETLDLIQQRQPAEEVMS